MADRGILFSAPMVRALLSGTKTQTRRALNPQPEGHVYRYGWELGKGATWSAQKGAPWSLSPSHGRIPMWVGDRLYVREAWRAERVLDKTKPIEIPEGEAIWWPADRSSKRMLGDRYGRKRPGIHMPRWASRLTLTVTDVRVERLQDISFEDAIAEGIERTGRHDEQVWKNYMPERYAGEGWLTPDNSYMTLWNSINGDGAWEADPWVVAYTFTVEKMNIDQCSPSTN